FLMAVSLGFGLVAAIGITQVMGRSNSAGPVKEEKKLPILIALQDIAANEELSMEMFSEEKWPARLVPSGVVTDLQEIEGMVSTSSVNQKGTVLTSNLLAKHRVREKRIPSNYKVIGIKLNADDHLNGLLEPGDLVDIMAIFRGDDGDVESGTTRTFLRKVKVWSIGSKTRKNGDMTEDHNGSTVVGLLVTESQSEKIIHAQRIAELKLAMRGSEDLDPSEYSTGTARRDLVDDEVEEEEDDEEEVAYDESDEEDTEEAVVEKTPRGPKPFTVVVHTSNGPTQYHFNQETSYVPSRVEGFNVEAPEESWDEEYIEESGDESAEEELEGEEEYDDDEESDDSDPLTDDLDSEPRN
ncbi:MAG: Flp pilus assembly protein CpaB, partial [Pirellulaceae bacterium]|nr:Flp pilus assembly protein CpaB [Pirellulaceae bacterium]